MSDFIYKAVPDGGGTNGFPGNIVVNKQGHLVIMDWLTWMCLAGKAFQVRAGTVTTPLVGDVVLTDQAAEYSVDAGTGYTIIPVYQNISIRLGTGTLHEYATKSINSQSTTAANFVPLPLRNLGPSAATAAAAATTARVSAAGGVAEAAEAVTTTRRHWSFSNPVAVAAGHEPVEHVWDPRTPPILAGPVSLYTQIAATGTGPSYYASIDYVEMVTEELF